MIDTLEAPAETHAPTMAPSVSDQQRPSPVLRDHVLGRVPGSNPDGPTLVLVGGLHGNEPAGTLAIRRVLATIEREAMPLRGQLLGLSGNLSAQAEKRRYLDRDLNRAWLPERVRQLRADGPAGWGAEDREQLELLDIFDHLLATARGELFIIDLHTTSGDGVPFGNMADTLHNRRFAMALPVPIIVGLEEELAGTMLDFLETRGFVTLGFESGQHDAPTSVDHAEAAIWIALDSAGLLPSTAGARLAAARALLADMCRSLPRVLEVLYRHAIAPVDAFRMLPGFTNFQPVLRQQKLAEDCRGDVCSPRSGRLLMPLYQKLGDDGFFLIREFRPLWLRVSTVCRRLRLDRAVRLLPGVHGVPGQPESVDVDQRIARWVALDLFHLLGYRRHRRQGNRVVLSRRLEPARARRAR
jgi:succinylglutamate desuccinylase